MLLLLARICGLLVVFQMTIASIATFALRLSKNPLEIDNSLESIKICLRPFAEISIIHEECPLGQKIVNKKDFLSSPSIQISIPPRIHVWQGGYALLVNLTYKSGEVVQLRKSGNLSGNGGWKELNFEKNEKTLPNGSAQLTCTIGFYGPRCSRRCSETERYKCSQEGTKVCTPEWTGDQCEKPICSLGCGNGTCVSPGKCQCHPGFDGLFCNQCLPIAGCLHGKCSMGQPNTCHCDRGWAGPLCDYDLEYCTRNDPCKNGGLCRNEGPKQFTCECPPGYSGQRCEFPVANPCLLDGICSNGGRCSSPASGSYHCDCPKGFSGEHCQIADFHPTINACLVNPCQNGATCLSIAEMAKCRCRNGFYGRFCELQSENDGSTNGYSTVAPNSAIIVIWISAFLILSISIYSLCKVVGRRGKFNRYDQQNCLNTARNRIYKALPGTKEIHPESRFSRVDLEKVENVDSSSEVRYSTTPRRIDGKIFTNFPLISKEIPDETEIYSEIVHPKNPQGNHQDEPKISMICNKIPFRFI